MQICKSNYEIQGRISKSLTVKFNNLKKAEYQKFTSSLEAQIDTFILVVNIRSNILALDEQLCFSNQTFRSRSYALALVTC